jgi:hypothetical protein
LSKHIQLGNSEAKVQTCICKDYTALSYLCLSFYAFKKPIHLNKFLNCLMSAESQIKRPPSDIFFSKVGLYYLLSHGISQRWSNILALLKIQSWLYSIEEFFYFPSFNISRWTPKAQQTLWDLWRQIIKVYSISTGFSRDVQPQNPAAMLWRR